MPDLRLDKWLWAARFFKSRSLAAAACEGGKVDLNGHAAKPSRAIRTGDRVEVTLRGGKRIARVRELSDRRGSGAQAALLYEDLTPPRPREERLAPPVHRPAGAGRPTKRDRRLLDRVARW